jgi:hypothetical protein
MTDRPGATRSRVPRFWFVLAGLAAFAAAYGQAPLYYSNQNQYFLHGLAAAGKGFLSQDWLAGTRDPTPLFSAGVAFIARHVHPWVFYLYHGLLLMLYAAALLGLFVALAGRETAARRWPVFLVLVVLVHSALMRWLSYQRTGVDYPWYLQAGVAGQYVLGAMLQPSVFGVFLVAAIALFALGHDIAAVILLALGATIHSTYLLPAGLLTAGFMTALVREGRWRRAVALGGLALVLVLPVTGYVLVRFAPTSPEVFADSQDILVNIRIPHHCLPSLWLDPVAALQLGWIGLGLGLLWGTRLFPALAVTAALAALLTIVQVATGSDTLALLFPWRISSVLMPVATATVLARLVALRWLPLERTAATVTAATGLVVLAAAGIAICAGGWAFRSGAEELPLYDYVREHRRPGDLYLLPVRVPDLKNTVRGSGSSDFKPPAIKRTDTQVIPVDLQRFRLATGTPIFVDFKAIPYRDTDVIEWRERLRLAQLVQKLLGPGEIGLAVDEMQRHAITHLVVPAGQELTEPTLTKLPFHDSAYQVYRVGGGAD